MRIALLGKIVGQMRQDAASPRSVVVSSRHAGVVDESANRRNTTLLSKLWCVAGAVLLVILTGCTGQPLFNSGPQQPTQVVQAAQFTKPAPKPKKAAPKPEPTQMELYEYIRSKLLSLSANDGINDNLEVSFDPEMSVLSVTQPDGHCDMFLSAIDTNSALWESADPSDASHPRGEVLRLTLNSASGKSARTCYDTQNRIDKSFTPNRARLFFSLAKANASPGFTEKMDKAIKKLIVQCGGAPEKQIL
jgi:hypothetical protein